MNKKIVVSLPINTTSEDISLFESFLQYNLPRQKIKYLHNIFVTYTGLCLDKRGLVKESHHDHPHQISDYQNEASKFYYDVQDNPDNLIILNDNRTYLLIHHPWYNYYHWILECIFRAYMVMDKKDGLILLLPDYYQHSDFIMGSLEPLGFSNIYFIPQAKSLLVKNLCIPQIKQRVDSYDQDMLFQVRNLYLSFVGNNPVKNVNEGDKIYISRKKATRKKIANEKEIEPILLHYGFKIIDNEDYTFLEQVELYSHVKCLISIHGSGLTNMLFMQEGALILEFHKRKTNEQDWHSKAFWYLADALKFNYYQQLCNPTNTEDDYFNANFIVNISDLEKNLKMMFHKEQVL